MSTSTTPQAVICVANDGNEFSLQLWKVYKPIRDDDAASEGLIRIIDESGEDYLFPAENFVPIDFPRGARTTTRGETEIDPRPPLTAGRITISAPSLTGVAKPPE